jgi:hypothetical protein
MIQGDPRKLSPLLAAGEHKACRINRLPQPSIFAQRAENITHFFAVDLFFL